MQLVEQHIVSKHSPVYNECDRLCSASKNIYNRALYLIQQEYKTTQTYNHYNDLYGTMKNEECLAQLPPKVAQATLRMVHGVVKSFFAMLHSEKVNKSNVNFPHFLNKTHGKYVTLFNNQTISKKVYKASHKIKLSQCNIEFYTKIDNFNQINCVTIIPQKEQYTISVTYTVPDVEKQKCNRKYASIDLGVNNLATVTFSEKGLQPLIFNGKPLKSINQFYNKELSKAKSKLEKINKRKHSHRTNRLTIKRNNKINNYLHKVSKHIVSSMVERGVTTLIIGKNPEWKTSSNMGSMNNQNFVQIPHSRFIEMLKYKCEKVGISVRIQEESYTSKCSFLDLEEIEKHEIYKGKRIKRGLYQSNNGRLINADVNGSYNIMRKAFPKLFKNGIEGVVVHPIVIKL